MQASKRYQCGNCGSLHRYRSDALTCCEPDVWDLYICAKCEKKHFTEDEANECCTETAEPKEHNDAEIRAELEARGQLRLVE